MKMSDSALQAAPSAWTESALRVLCLHEGARLRPGQPVRATHTSANRASQSVPRRRHERCLHKRRIVLLPAEAVSCNKCLPERLCAVHGCFEPGVLQNREDASCIARGLQ